MITERKMSRGVLFLVLIGLIVCILVFLLFADAAGAWLVVRKFVLPTPPSRACPITSLLVDTTGFPSGTTVGKIESPLVDGPLDFTGPYQEAGRTLVVGGGWGGVHYVYRARTARRAAHQYQTLKDIEFRTTPNDGPWEPPPQFGYRSSIADQYYLACGNDHGRYTCRMMAQYEEYYMLLQVPMPGMTFEDLEVVLRAIDERMAECLGKPLPSSPE